MKVCFVVTEYFGWGLFGGFGKLSRTIAVALAKKGLDVHVLMNKSEREKQPSYCQQDGVHIHAFPRKILVSHIGLDFACHKLAREIDADIYHSQEVSLWTLHVEQAMKQAKHVITFQDPELTSHWQEWRSSPYFYMEDSFPTKVRKAQSRWLRAALYNSWKKRAVRNADLLCSQTRYHIPEIKRIYNVTHDPIFLPNPIEVPTYTIKKSDVPTVLFLARWDVIKRPWIFFQIAKRMPNMRFICAGKSHDPVLDVKLRRIASKIPNLVCPGHIDPKKVLDESWVLLNCSVKESLPVSFLEGFAHKNALVSCNNPDNLASNFGIYIRDGENIDEYVDALKTLLSNRSELGRIQQSGFEYVKETHELSKVTDQHIKIYEVLLA